MLGPRNSACPNMTLDVNELSAFYASPLGETSRRADRPGAARALGELRRPVADGPGLLRPLSRPLPRRGAAHAGAGAGRTGRRALARGRALAPPRWSSATCCRCPTPASTARSSPMRWRRPSIRARCSRRCGACWRPRGGRSSSRRRGAGSGRGSTARRSATASRSRAGNCAISCATRSFSAVFWGEALYAPPFRRRVFVNWAPAIERVGAALRPAFRRRPYRRGDQAGLSARRRAPPRAQAPAAALEPALAPTRAGGRL